MLVLLAHLPGRTPAGCEQNPSLLSGRSWPGLCPDGGVGAPRVRVASWDTGLGVLRCRGAWRPQRLEERARPSSAAAPRVQCRVWRLEGTKVSQRAREGPLQRQVARGLALENWELCTWGASPAGWVPGPPGGDPGQVLAHTLQGCPGESQEAALPCLA